MTERVRAGRWLSWRSPLPPVWRRCAHSLSYWALAADPSRLASTAVRERIERLDRAERYIREHGGAAAFPEDRRQALVRWVSDGGAFPKEAGLTDDHP